MRAPSFFLSERITREVLEAFGVQTLQDISDLDEFILQPEPFKPYEFM